MELDSGADLMPSLCVSSGAKLIVNMDCFIQCFERPEKECNFLVRHTGQ